MYSSVISAAVVGVEAKPVSVEAVVSEGMPVFNMVGFLAGEVREAQDRVRTAVKAVGETLPVKRITVNLSPADLRKEGAGFDLPIAAAVLEAARLIPPECTKNWLLVGELGLSGSIRPVRGVLQMVDLARRLSCTGCIIPADNLREGSFISGIRVLGAKDLAGVIDFFRGKGQLEEMQQEKRQEVKAYPAGFHPDFSSVRGQRTMRRCTEIAVAGFHNLLLIGAPGAGKSLAAKCIPSILPSLTWEEMMEITRIHSVAGTLPPEGIMTVRPFRAPHHTASAAALAGGGRSPRPGEISLAHGGVLFLDELPEFPASTLEILRQPMEDGTITVSRLSGSCTFPAHFMLVGSANPCPCGHWPDRNRCRCTKTEVRKYMERISQPLLDRIDICTEVREPSYQDLTGEAGESSAVVRARVELACEQQMMRYKGTRIRFNSELDLEAAGRYCALDDAGRKLLEQLYEQMHLTGRTCLKILRVARTIADLDGEEAVKTEHLMEAASYRLPDRNTWGNL